MNDLHLQLQLLNGSAMRVNETTTYPLALFHAQSSTAVSNCHQPITMLHQPRSVPRDGRIRARRVITKDAGVVQVPYLIYISSSLGISPAAVAAVSIGSSLLVEPPSGMNKRDVIASVFSSPQAWSGREMLEFC